MKKLTKNIKKYTEGAVTLGVGSAIGAKLAVQAPGASVTPAFSSAAGMMPMVGTTMMGTGVLRMVGKLSPKKRKRRRK
jgi:predicted phage tail protein